MKKIIAWTATAVFVGSVSMSAASKTQSLETAPEQDTVTSIEQSLKTMQQSFSGLVKKTDQGLMLETNNGIYHLKGLSLEEIVGKEVYITGVVKSDDKTSTIYVVKADVKN